MFMDMELLQQPPQLGPQPTWMLLYNTWSRPNGKFRGYWKSESLLVFYPNPSFYPKVALLYGNSGKAIVTRKCQCLWPLKRMHSLLLFSSSKLYPPLRKKCSGMHQSGTANRGLGS